MTRLARTATILLAGFALSWGAGFLWFATAIPAADADEPVDAIVVLTGGSERLATGIALLDSGQGRVLFVSGVHKGVDVIEMMRQARALRPDLAQSIVPGYTADDTRGNADETARWMQDQGLASLRLVTAGYHMRRALLEFRRAMPEARILAHPVFPDAVKQHQWWRWPGTALLLATEYTKYLAARVRHALSP